MVYVAHIFFFYFEDSAKILIQKSDFNVANVIAV